MSRLQQWWHGISPCMELGVGDCVVWWDAWAAVGTISAVVTALALAGAESRRRNRDAYGRSMWIALGLRPCLNAWLTRLQLLRKELEANKYDASLSVIGNPEHFLKPPDTIIEMRPQVPELGEIAVPLAQGMSLLTEVLAEWEGVDRALRGLRFVQPPAAIATAVSKLRAAEQLLQKAEADLHDRLRQPKLVKVRAYLVKVRAYIAMRIGRRKRNT